jgi:hypothetical protein
MARRVGFTLTRQQIEAACESFVAARLLPDEEARATLIASTGPSDNIMCEIDVSKKRKPRTRKPRGNGVASAGPLSDAEQRFA